ncbi:MAG: DUF362 domain-containing protein [Geminicoccaceae bacterium]|nr:DUF362 domain-containing protein [Geminicoccaceae bacterium]
MRDRGNSGRTGMEATRRQALALGALAASAARARPLRASEPRATVWITAAGDPVRALDLVFARLPRDLASGKRLVLKANFNSADPFPAASAPDTLDALVARLASMRPSRFTLAERSGMGDTRAVLRQAGVPALAARHGLEVLVLDELGPEGWVAVRWPDLHWRRGFLLARAFAEAELVVQTCCLKTHRFGGHFTMALKNAVGAVAKVDPADGYDYMRKLHASPHQRAMIAEISTAFRHDLVIMDARKGFRTGGPESGTLVEPGLFLASRDPVAIDAVGVAILRRYGTTAEVARGPIFAQEQLARAAALGIGVASAAAIELEGLDEAGRRASEELRPLLV